MRVLDEIKEESNLDLVNLLVELLSLDWISFAMFPIVVI